MSRHDAVKALNIYKRAGQQVYNVLWNFFLTVFNEYLPHRHFFELKPLSFLVIQAESLADLYDYCKGLDLARNFQFPTLRQVPFLPKKDDI